MTSPDVSHGMGKAAANGAELCFESFGEPGAPALLLIGGAAASMDWWECGTWLCPPCFSIRGERSCTGWLATLQRCRHPYREQALTSADCAADTDPPPLRQR
jgi:hypothetical protein